jgi:hypothetical protein
MADGDLFTNAGFRLPSKTGGAAVAAQAAGSLFKDAGFTLPSAAAPAAQSQPSVPMIGNRRLEPWEYTPGASNPNPQPPPKSELQKINEAMEPIHFLVAGARDAAGSTAENFSGSKEMAKSGVQDLRNLQIMPSFPSSDPQTWSGGGALKTLAGGVGMATAPISGTIDALVNHPVTELTGNPDIGNRAGLVAGFALGGPKSVAVAKNVTPTSKALNTLVEAIGPENVPGAVARLKTNPRLTLMDVSDPVRTMAQGLIDPAQPAAQRIVSNAVKDRITSAPAAVNTAYTTAMGAAPDVVKVVDAIKKKAQDVGSTMIQPAVQSARPVDITNVVKSLDSTIGPVLKDLQAGETPKLPMTQAQKTAWEIRQRLRGSQPDEPAMVMDAAQAHEIQSQLRYEASQLASSAVGSERLTAGQVGNARGQLVDAIDQAAGGRYKPALSKYRDAKMVQEAFESGFDTLKNRSGVSGLEDRPESFREWMRTASPEETRHARRYRSEAQRHAQCRPARH